ncbi:cupin domain-containing protein [Actinomycetospora sp. C-140]
MSVYTTSTDTADEHWFLGTLATIRASATGTGSTMSIVEFLHPPGFATPPHVHHRADEAFYVLAGSLVGFSGDTEFRAEAGGFVWLPREIPHGYRARGDQLLRTLAITMPGGMDEFVAALSEPARERALPEAPFFPDPAEMTAVASRHDITHLGPPGAMIPAADST